MQLTAETPHYLPALDYFLKMSLADHFVIADEQRFSGQGAVCRGAIKAAHGKQWLSVPVLRKEGQRIREARIDPRSNWRQKHWKALQVNYAYAPYFEYFDDFFDILYRKKWIFLIDLNMTIIDYLRDTLRIETTLSKTSAVTLTGDLTEQTLQLLAANECHRYLIEPAVENLLDRSRLAAQGISLLIPVFKHPRYRQQFGSIMEGLSVLDLLFNEGPESLWILAKSIPQTTYKKS